VTTPEIDQFSSNFLKLNCLTVHRAGWCERRNTPQKQAKITKNSFYKFLQKNIFLMKKSKCWCRFIYCCAIRFFLFLGSAAPPYFLILTYDLLV